MVAARKSASPTRCSLVMLYRTETPEPAYMVLETTIDIHHLSRFCARQRTDAAVRRDFLRVLSNDATAVPGSLHLHPAGGVTVCLYDVVKNRSAA